MRRVKIWEAEDGALFRTWEEAFSYETDIMNANKIARFKKLVATMDIPAERREPSKANLGWFFRNVRIKNATHPNIIQAWDLAKELDSEA
jgi:hypothetical protein